MRKLLIAFITLSINYLPVYATAYTVPLAISNQKEFRPYGYFSMIGNPPRGFGNFDSIQYWMKSVEQSGPDISERLSGVNVRRGIVYRYSTISVNRKIFSFTTKQIKGISYSFIGRFLRTDFVESEYEPNRPVLKGTLKKYKNGKKIAEAKTKFSYFAGT